MMSLEKLAYLELSKNEGFNVDTIKVGHTYEALNFDGQTYTDLGKCLRNEWNDEMEPNFGNDFSARPQYRFLTFDTRDYPTKKIVKQIIDANKFASVLIFPSDDIESVAAPAVESAADAAVESAVESAAPAVESASRKRKQRDGEYSGGYKYKRKTHKRKTHKRKTHKRKSYKRKTHKRKSYKRKT